MSINRKFNKVFVLSILLIFILGACTDNTTTKEPDQIGHVVFEMLKKLSTGSKQEFVQDFLSVEEMRKMAKDKELVKNEGIRNKITSTLKEEWNVNIEKLYNSLKEDGAAYGIEWNDIKYLDYIYKIEQNDGLNTCEGKLYFKYNDKSYNVKTGSIFDGNEYKLVEIDQLRASH